MSETKAIQEDIETDTVEQTVKQKREYKKPLLSLVALIIIIIGAIASYVGYLYVSSPAQIRNPAVDHYHFRMQILVDGKAEDFSTDKYQEAYSKDQCTAALPTHPIHFHDKKDQFVHIHWRNMTGGLVLKYYGWNKIGGIDGTLGYRFDDSKHISKVAIHGNALPAVSKDDNYYVYMGDEHGYKERSFDDFKSQKLEDFFGKRSNLPTPEEIKKETGLLNILFPKVLAHGVDETAPAPGTTETEEEKLTRINNFIGNVVIFVQKDKPTDQQIKTRFDMLQPLSESTCGG